MNPKWKWFIPGYIWSSPLIVFGLLWAVLLCRAHSWKFSNGIITCISERIPFRPGAQTFSIVQIYKDEASRNWGPLNAHETGHTVQAFIGGIVFAIVYLGLFGYNWIKQFFMHLIVNRNIMVDWRGPYHEVIFEIWCYRIQDRFIAGKTNVWHHRG